MAKIRILIIDSDVGLVRSISEHLIASGYEVRAVSEVKDTGFLRAADCPHLILLDVLVAGMNGLELVQQIRRESPIPILILTTKNEVTDRIGGLEAGADDYVAKPFEPREVAARISSILRRVPASANHGYEQEVREWHFNGLRIQANRRRVLVDNQTVELTTAEFDLLRLLVNNAKNPLTREMILDQLRGIEWEAVDRSIDILISRLRDKLRDNPRSPRFIRTIRSVGYQFVGEPTDQNQLGLSG